MKAHSESEKLMAAMMASDRIAAAAFIEQALAGGMPPRQVIAEIHDPAIVELGRLWQTESIRQRNPTYE